MLHRTHSGCCEKDIGSSKAHIPQMCEHGELLLYSKQLKRSEPIRRVSEKREGEVRRRGSTLKRGRGFAASREQQETVRGLPCAFCGKEQNEYLAIDPAHLWPRSRGGCDHCDCVIPLCRDRSGEGCHKLFDEGKIDLLPKLIDRGYQAELAHPITAHGVSLTPLLERVTGQRWAPLATDNETASAVSERSTA